MANYSKEDLQYIASQVQPYLLELVKANGLDVDNVEVVEDTDGITSLPAYDNRGGTKKVVRVPLSTFAKPAEDAAATLQESIDNANAAATAANSAAERADASVTEINGIKSDIEQAVQDAQQAVQDSQSALTEVSDKIEEISSSESDRNLAEEARQQAETARANEFEALKDGMESSIQDADEAASNANDTANHPTYIGEDNYVYVWNKESQQYDMTAISVKGEKGDNGLEPVLQIGDITTLEPSEPATAELVLIGETEQGNPLYELVLSIPKGNKGENGTGSGNVLVDASTLDATKTYLFTPNQNGSSEGKFVEFDSSSIDTSNLATKTELSAKQDRIDDLDTIREGAALGATAIQEHQDISHLATKEEISDMLTKTEAEGTYQPKGDYAEKDDIITKEDGDGTKYLADDGTYKEVDALPGGGTAGQVLTRTEDGAAWSDPSSGAGFVAQTDEPEDTSLLWVDTDDTSDETDSIVGVDAYMSDTSVNPVQNAVVKQYIDSRMVAVTEAEYEALGDSVNSDGVLYLITE